MADTTRRAVLLRHLPGLLTALGCVRAAGILRPHDRPLDHSVRAAIAPAPPAPVEQDPDDIPTGRHLFDLDSLRPH